MNYGRNIRLTAEKTRGGFHIYMDLSGRRDYLMTHRSDEVLYGLLKDGIRLEDLRRWKPSDRVEAHPSIFTHGERKRVGRHRLEQLSGSVRHLISVADDYIRYEAC